MKSILIGLTLLASISSFAGTNLKTIHELGNICEYSDALYFPSYPSDEQLQQEAEEVAHMLCSIQGLAADILKTVKTSKTETKFIGGVACAKSTFSIKYNCL